MKNHLVFLIKIKKQEKTILSQDWNEVIIPTTEILGQKIVTESKSFLIE